MHDPFSWFESKTPGGEMKHGPCEWPLSGVRYTLNPRVLWNHSPLSTKVTPLILHSLLIFFFLSSSSPLPQKEEN